MLIGAGGDSIHCDNFMKIDFTKLKFSRKYKDNVVAFMREQFIPMLKKINEDNKYELPALLIGIMGEIFFIDSDYAVVIPPACGFAIGSSSLPARAALYTMTKLDKKLNPLKIVKTALEAAENTTDTCRSPYHYLEL